MRGNKKQTGLMKQGDLFSQTFKISESVYNGFLSVFNDRNPVHVDSAYAQKLGFREKIMHGNILGGFLSYFIGECLPVKNVVIHLQEIKYLKPVFLNDELNFSAKITEVHESVNAIGFSFVFENVQQVKVAKGKIQIGIIT